MKLRNFFLFWNVWLWIIMEIREIFLSLEARQQRKNISFEHVYTSTLFNPMTFVCKILSQCSMESIFKFLYIFTLLCTNFYQHECCISKFYLKIEMHHQNYVEVWKSIGNVQHFYLKKNRIWKQFNFYQSFLWQKIQWNIVFGHWRELKTKFDLNQLRNGFELSHYKVLTGRIPYRYI